MQDISKDFEAFLAQLNKDGVLCTFERDDTLDRADIFLKTENHHYHICANKDEKNRETLGCYVRENEERSDMLSYGGHIPLGSLDVHHWVVLARWMVGMELKGIYKQHFCPASMVLTPGEINDPIPKDEAFLSFSKEIKEISASLKRRNLPFDLQSVDCENEWTAIFTPEFNRTKKQEWLKGYRQYIVSASTDGYNVRLFLRRGYNDRFDDENVVWTKTMVFGSYNEVTWAEIYAYLKNQWDVDNAEYDAESLSKSFKETWIFKRMIGAF